MSRSNYARNSQARKIGALAETKKEKAEVKELQGEEPIVSMPSSGQWSAGLVSGNFNLANYCVNGTTPVTRIGRSILMTKLVVRWTVGRTSGAPTGAITNPFRILVFYDKDYNFGVNPLATDILNANDINGQFNLNNSERYLILVDSYPLAEQKMNPSKKVSGATGYSSGFAGKIVRHFNPPLKAFYPVDTEGYAYGSIWYGACSTAHSGIGPFSPQEMTINTRIRFTDA